MRKPKSSLSDFAALATEIVAPSCTAIIENIYVADWLNIGFDKSWSIFLTLQSHVFSLGPVYNVSGNNVKVDFN